MTSRIFFARYILNILNSMTPCTYNFSTITSHIYPVACSPSRSLSINLCCVFKRTKAESQHREKEKWVFIFSIHPQPVSDRFLLVVVVVGIVVSPHANIRHSLHISHFTFILLKRRESIRFLAKCFFHHYELHALSFWVLFLLP